MLRKMSWAQFQEWMDFAAMEPFGEERADLRAGHTTAAVYNVNRDTRRHPKPFSAWDFLLTPKKKSGDSTRKPVKSVEVWNKIKSKFRVLFSASAEDIE